MRDNTHIFHMIYYLHWNILDLFIDYIILDLEI